MLIMSGKCGGFFGAFGIGFPIPSIPEFFYKMGIYVMTGIWYAIDYIYQLFMALGSARLFKEETIAAFSQRIYIVLGIVMLFFVTYQLFLMLISPDKLSSKGEDGGPKLVSNIIVTIIILTLTTFVFNIAYAIQDNILAEDIIGKLLFGTSGRYQSGEVKISSDDMYYNGGKAVATSVFSAFYFPKTATTFEATNSIFDKKIFVLDTGPNPGTYSYNEIMKTVETTGPMYLIDLSCTSITDVVEFPWLFGLLAGGFCLWVLLSYCIDMGLRVIKMAFYQIIAPLTISMRIIPKQKKVYDKWLTDTLSCFADIFVRIFIMYFSIYIIKLLQVTFSSTFGALWATSVLPKPSFSIQLFAKGLIIVGVFKFILDAPKLFGDIFGIKMEGSSPFTPGIFKRFNDNKLLKASTGMVGGALGSAWDNARNAKATEPSYTMFRHRKRSDRATNFRRKTSSAAGGLLSGAYRGFRSGFDPNAQFIKNIRDTRMINSQRRKDKEDKKVPTFGETVRNVADSWVGSGSRSMELDARITAAEKAHKSHEAIKAVFDVKARKDTLAEIDNLTATIGRTPVVTDAEIVGAKNKSERLMSLNNEYNNASQAVTTAANNVTAAQTRKTEIEQKQISTNKEIADMQIRRQTLVNQQFISPGQVNPQIDYEIKMGDIKLQELNNQLGQLGTQLTTAANDIITAQGALLTAQTAESTIHNQVMSAAQREDASIVDPASLSAAATAAQTEYETVKTRKVTRETAEKNLADANQKLKTINDMITRDPNNIQILKEATESLARSALLLSDKKFVEEMAARFGKTVADIKYDPSNPSDLKGIEEFITQSGATTFSSLVDGSSYRASEAKKKIEQYAPAPKEGKK